MTIRTMTNTITTPDRVLQVRYSLSVDALYVQLAEGKVDWTDDLGGLRHVDYAADGTVLGVEILSPRALGVELTNVPDAEAVGDELRRLGFRILQPAPPA